jgi:hypothetical protein
MLFSFLFLTAILQVSDQPTESSAPPPQASASVTQTQSDAAANRRVCRSEIVVGTRLSERVCMTQREWDQRRQQSRELAHRLEVQNSNRGRIEAPGH